MTAVIAKLGSVRWGQRFFLPFMALLLGAAAALSACSGSSGPEPTPLPPDLPAKTSSDIWGALNMHVIALRHTKDHYATVDCSLKEATYEGHGYWRCGSWIVNERSGEILKGDGSSSGRVASHH